MVSQIESFALPCAINNTQLSNTKQISKKRKKRKIPQGKCNKLKICPNNCRLKCTDISESTRKIVTNKFWEITDRTLQWRIISKYVEISDRNEGQKYRYNYHIPVINDNDIVGLHCLQKIRVCKPIFLHTFGITEKLLRIAVTKHLMASDEEDVSEDDEE